MFKKIFLTVLLAIGTLACWSQRFYVFNTDGVNLRERPTTSSPRLMEYENEIGDIEYSFTEGEYPARAWQGAAYYSPKSNGEWTCIVMPNFFDDVEVWVMTKFLTEVRPTKIATVAQLDRVIKECGLDGWYHLRTVGEDAGVILTQQDGYGDNLLLWSEFDPQRGIIESRYADFGYFVYEPGRKPLGFGQYGEIYYHDNHVTDEMWDINKLSHAELMSIKKRLKDLSGASVGIPQKQTYYFAPQAGLPQACWVDIRRK